MKRRKTQISSDKLKSKTASVIVNVGSNGVLEGKKPNLAELSKDLPSGWQVRDIHLLQHQFYLLLSSTKLSFSNKLFLYILLHLVGKTNFFALKLFLGHQSVFLLIFKNIDRIFGMNLPVRFTMVI